MRKTILTAAAMISAAIVLSSGIAAAARTVSAALTFRDITVTMDGRPLEIRDAYGNVTEPFIYNDTAYLPIRAIAEAVGLNVRWDGENNAIHFTHGAPEAVQQTASAQDSAGYIYEMKTADLEQAIQDGRGTYESVTQMLSKYSVSASSTNGSYADMCKEYATVTVLTPYVNIVRRSYLNNQKFEDYTLDDAMAFYASYLDKKNILIEIHAPESSFSTSPSFYVGLLQGGNVIETTLSGENDYPSRSSYWPKFPEYFRTEIVSFSQSALDINNPVQLVIRYAGEHEIVYNINLSDYV